MALEERLLKTAIAEYVPATWSGRNLSGYRPMDDKVLILPDVAASKIGSIHMTDDNTERHTMASESGVIIALGPAAFVLNSGRTGAWTGEIPGPGTRVHIERYSGQLLHGRDGQLYRVMDYTCIGAIEIADEDEPPAIDRVVG